jgi:hypothetical protein
VLPNRYSRVSCVVSATLAYIPGVKRPRRGVNHPPHLALRVKKQWSYTSALLLCLDGLY